MLGIISIIVLVAIGSVMYEILDGKEEVSNAGMASTYFKKEEKKKEESSLPIVITF